MNLTSGVFTAPTNGSYFFSFDAVSSFTAANEREETKIYLELNGVVARSFERPFVSKISFKKIIKLQKGDEIRLRLSNVANPGSIKELDGGSRLTHFTGILLKQEANMISEAFIFRRNKYLNTTGLIEFEQPLKMAFTAQSEFLCFAIFSFLAGLSKHNPVRS